MIYPGNKAKPGIFSRFLLTLFCFAALNVPAFPQTTYPTPRSGDTTVVAGKQYDKSFFHEWLWGRHYRKDWATPVNVNFIYLDTVNGGLKAYEKGGGRQSTTVRLSNHAGKEYVLRSIDKSFGKALPEIYRGTFIEKIVDDQVSIAEPYAAVTIPGMAEAAGIYHTNPVIVFVPAQPALGEFNKDVADDLYLFEQRPDENWEEAPNFGNAKKIVGTDKMLENIFEDNESRVDQLGFIRARLFDMFIGDWGRHEDQWRWAEYKDEDGDKKLYKAIPRDRDQVYTKFDGALLGLGLSAADAGHLQTFSGDIKDVASYNFPARNLDRQLANEPGKEEWTRIAKELQQALTDAVIENSVRQLPPEVFVLSGQGIIDKLKSRRNNLVDFATEYYSFLAKEVEIVGSQKAERFEITALAGNSLSVNVYDLDKEGNPKKKPFYSRVFHSAETKEIRVYGLTGEDQYRLDMKAGSGTRIRIIGGPSKDNYQTISSGGQVHVYDNGDNDFSNLAGAKKHLSSNPFVHLYNYDGFRYDKKGLGPVISYNTQDHIHVGLKYTIEKQQWRKYPFGHHQEFAVKYSIGQQAFSFGYEGQFTRLVGNWDLRLDANYDLVRWNNYFGIGNETKMPIDNRDYNRVRSKEFYAGAGLERIFSHYQQVGITGYYQTIAILNDPGRFLTEQTPKFLHFTPTRFAGAKLDYSYKRLNNNVVPTKGILFTAGIDFAQNLDQPDSNVTRFSSVLNLFIPLSKSFVFTLKTGGATLTGKPEFYQLNRLTGSKTLRGFRKYRFYGESMFYNQAELQFIKDIKTFLFNGKAGLIALYDIGRVWQPGEESDTWHYGYGGGIMLAPFNKFSVAVFYALSRDERDISVRFIKGL